MAECKNRDFPPTSAENVLKAPGIMNHVLNGKGGSPECCPYNAVPSNHPGVYYMLEVEPGYVPPDERDDY